MLRAQTSLRRRERRVREESKVQIKVRGRGGSRVRGESKVQVQIQLRGRGGSRVCGGVEGADLAEGSRGQ